jgi:hypothetical protein
MSERPFSDAAQKRLADRVINLVVRIVRGYWTLVASLACLESCVGGARPLQLRLNIRGAGIRKPQSRLSRPER